MCVIIFKPKGIKMPPFGILQRAAAHNPHGFGFVTPTAYCRSMDFMQVYRELCKVPQDAPCLMHFRYATHGSRCVNNCHPFRDGDLFFMHNGVIPIFPIDDKTDSETLFIEKFSPAAKSLGLDNPYFDDIVYDNLYGRYAFMKGEKVKLYGSYIQRDGCYFSNLLFI